MNDFVQNLCLIFGFCIGIALGIFFLSCLAVRFADFLIKHYFGR